LVGVFGSQHSAFLLIDVLSTRHRWRNSVGLGIFIVVRVICFGQLGSITDTSIQVKDCVSLLHLYLTKREIQTRRVKNRSFNGIDIRELDLVLPPPMTLF
jgi:hypothetical protein